MKYVMYVLLIGLIFGLIALVDQVVKRLFRRRRPAPAVRLPGTGIFLGLAITLVAVASLLLLPSLSVTLKVLFCLLPLMGLYLVVHTLRFGIFYDEHGFRYRSGFGKERAFSYGDIRGQRSFLARSGVNVILYAGSEELSLYAAMKGLQPFLQTAFDGWCKATGTDPDTVENNPDLLVFFPEP